MANFFQFSSVSIRGTLDGCTFSVSETHGLWGYGIPELGDYSGPEADRLALKLWVNWFMAQAPEAPWVLEHDEQYVEDSGQFDGGHTAYGRLAILRFLEDGSDDSSGVENHSCVKDYRSISWSHVPEESFPGKERLLAKARGEGPEEPVEGPALVPFPENSIGVDRERGLISFNTKDKAFQQFSLPKELDIRQLQMATLLTTFLREQEARSEDCREHWALFMTEPLAGWKCTRYFKARTLILGNSAILTYLASQVWGGGFHLEGDLQVIHSPHARQRRLVLANGKTLNSSQLELRRRWEAFESPFPEWGY